MFLRKIITEEEKQDVINVCDVILHPDTNNNIIMQLFSDKEISSKTRINLWKLSLREWWDFKKASNLFINEVRKFKQIRREKIKINELIETKKDLVRSKKIEKNDVAYIVHHYWDHIIIWYPYWEQKSDKTKFHWTTIIFENDTPELFKECIKNRELYEW